MPSTKKHISKLEQSVLSAVTEKKDILFIALISVLAVAVRFFCFPFISRDMELFLIPWYDIIKEEGGLPALSMQVGDYNILYQTLIALFSYLPIEKVAAYKLLSCVFDFFLAGLAAKIVCSEKKGSHLFTFAVTYCIFLFLPNVFLNSAYWGQCDAIYTYFCILSLITLYREKYTPAFLFFGLAFACKLQTVFFLPFYISVYFTRRSFSIGYFFLALLVCWLTGILGFVYGRSLLAPFLIYFHQVEEYSRMYANFHSFWVLTGDNYFVLRFPAMILAAVLCGIGMYAMLHGKKRFDSLESFLNTATWFSWTVILFLPVMHERYTYAVDILLVLLSFLNIRYIGFAFLTNILSLLTYRSELTRTPWIETASGTWGSAIHVAAWIAFTIFILRKEKNDTQIR